MVELTWKLPSTYQFHKYKVSSSDGQWQRSVLISSKCRSVESVHHLLFAWNSWITLKWAAPFHPPAVPMTLCGWICILEMNMDEHSLSTPLKRTVKPVGISPIFHPSTPAQIGCFPKLSRLRGAQQHPDAHLGRNDFLDPKNRQNCGSKKPKIGRKDLKGC
jgi:hypothetical protein